MSTSQSYKDKNTVGGNWACALTQQPALHPRQPALWKIFLPDAMCLPLAQFYHDMMVHSVGMDKLEAMIRQHFSNPEIRPSVQAIISNCTICPRVHLGSQQFGHLAPRDVPLIPWSGVHIHFISPWPVTVNKLELKFNVLTMIDPVTNLL